MALHTSFLLFILSSFIFTADAIRGCLVCQEVNQANSKLDQLLQNKGPVTPVPSTEGGSTAGPATCKQIYDKSLANGDKAYQLTMRDVGEIPVFCHMTGTGLGECGGGGWTMVMKIDGSKKTFHYDSPYWSNKIEYGLPEGATGLDTEEVKLPTYWNTPFTKICLGMKNYGQLRFIVVKKTATSLHSLIADGKHRELDLGRDKWKTLIGTAASLQTHCNQEGFNSIGKDKGRAKARIGIIGNEQNDCNSCDSRIGFGTGGADDDSNTCGNEATNAPDNANKHIKTWGYILVQ